MRRIILPAIEVWKKPIKLINKVTDLGTQLSKEFDLFISGDDSGEYLQGGYSYLGTIVPTSGDCKRSFSTYVDNKIRSGDMLDDLIFLKNHFKQ